MFAAMPLPPSGFPPRDRDPKAEGLEVRRLRESIGWSQEVTARMLGVSTKTLARWEAGEPCQWSALELLRSWTPDKPTKKK
jgi:DNA-binding transcriptional regulator YiaG